MSKFVYDGKEVTDNEAAHHLSIAYPYAIDKFEQCQEVYLLAVKTAAGYLKKVPAAYRSRELLYAAVEANGLAADFLTDEEMGDEGLLIAALKNNGDALQGIRERMPVNERLLDAAAASSESSCAAAYMLPEELTEERCLTIVQTSRDGLWLIPRAKQTPAVCRAAVVKWLFPDENIQHGPQILPVPIDDQPLDSAILDLILRNIALNAWGLPLDSDQTVRTRKDGK
jgi:hypothetical protein